MVASSRAAGPSLFTGQRVGAARPKLRTEGGWRRWRLICLAQVSLLSYLTTFSIWFHSQSLLSHNWCLLVQACVRPLPTPTYCPLLNSVQETVAFASERGRLADTVLSLQALMLTVRTLQSLRLINAVRSQDAMWQYAVRLGKWCWDFNWY